MKTKVQLMIGANLFTLMRNGHFAKETCLSILFSSYLGASHQPGVIYEQAMD